ncbi:MAG: fructosamine kinase family protein [Chloroflexota bacterium]
MMVHTTLTTTAAITDEVFKAKPDSIREVSGGSINQAVRVGIGSSLYFIKWKMDAPPYFFAAEAHSLHILHEAGAIRVPEVISVGEPNADRPAYLVLEWIEEAPPTPVFAAKFGAALAQLHRHTNDLYGLNLDDYVGEWSHPVAQSAHWLDFYRDQRLVPQIARAQQLGRLPAKRAAMLDQLVMHLDKIIGGVPSVPALLHGDLWGGNFLVAEDDRPVIFDPAVYYGDHEMELAFTELFGGFPAGFYSAYREAYPLEAGYEVRRPLYQLYHLLVHLNLFGESYGSRVDAVCRYYVG